MTKTKNTILVAEDDHYLANQYRLKLEKAGYEVILASTGEDVLIMLKKTKPDLIILDLVMPKMDGFAVLEKIKKDPLKKSIPIIVVTNLGQKEDFERVKILGMQEYFIKSNIDLDFLVTRIKSLLEK